MKTAHHPLAFACIATAALLAAGCSDDDAPDAGAGVGLQTVDVTTAVVDGALKNALVCLDRNANDACDADEPQGRTDDDGKITLKVAADDLGKYPMLAVVGTDAVDHTYGPVTQAFTLSAPAGRSGVISPLSTLANQLMRDSGIGSAEADQALQTTIGTTVSVYDDYTKATDGVDLQSLAHFVVVAAEAQTAAVAPAKDATASDGKAITQAELDAAVRKKVQELLPGLVDALSTAAAKDDAALRAAAKTVVTAGGLDATSVEQVVALDRMPVDTSAPSTTAFVQMHTLGFTDATHYTVRYLSGTAAEQAVDSAGMQRFVDRHYRAAGGPVAAWAAGNNPRDNAILHWNGTAWAACGLGFESKNTPRDAAGNSRYDYCAGWDTGTTKRVVDDVVDRSMAAVYKQMRDAGRTNLTIANADAALGSATFPPGSKVLYQRQTGLTSAISYDPSATNVVGQYSAATSAGGVASTQPAGTACNDPALAGTGSPSTTLETLVERNKGTPCTFAVDTLNAGGNAYKSDDPNVAWSNSTLSIGTIGSALVNTGVPTSYFTGNTLLRVAFNGSSANGVTYYACKQRFTSGGSRGCKSIGSGTYAIATLGDARIMTFASLPTMVAALTYARVFVERGGHVYYGYQNRPIATNQVRLNGDAARALAQQLGLTMPDPDVPLKLTATSYQGTWDIRDSNATDFSDGIALILRPDGTTACQEADSPNTFGCTLTFSDTAPGAFTLAGDTFTLSGTFDFLAGSVAGTYHDPAGTPADGNFVAVRR